MKYSNRKVKNSTGFGIYKYKNIYFVFVIILNLCAPRIYGQPKIDSNILEIKCQLPKIVRTNKDLNMKITIRNMSFQLQYFYDGIIVGQFSGELLSGDKSSFVDMSFEVEKKVGKYYKSYTGNFFDSAPNSDTSNFPKRVKVNSGDSLIYYFQIDQRYPFEIGEYRLRCTFWNDVHVNNYVESKWIYFRVLNYISTKNNYGKK